MEDRITLEAIQRMRDVMKAANYTPTMFIFRAYPKVAQEFTESLGAEYAPEGGEQVVGDYLIQTVQEDGWKVV